ncbi:MAG: divergent polysaccharide deacetylase family protein [Candidatus Aminicenantes bacterium]|nr:divergent polysaccharide deacetylase family protein [Candidatus Aminicenantes bacterium]
MRPGRKISGLFLPIFIFIIIILISWAGLDYLQLKKETNQSFLFFFFLSKKASLFSWIDREFLPFLQQQTEASYKIIEIIDKPTPMVSIEMPEETYENLVKKIKDKLIQSGFQYKIRLHEEGPTTRLLEWQLQAKLGQKATIKFNLIRPIQPKPLPPSEFLPSEISKKKPIEKMASLIIDDLGENLEAIKAIVNLSRPVNVAIIPFSPFAQETAKMALNHGLEIMLHLPLESINSDNNGGKSLIEINSRMSQEQVLTTLKECFEALPEIRGVNNHMGSLITQKKEIMEIILLEIKSRGLFFIDSRTTDKSIAYKLAKELGLDCGQRDIFLDSEVNRQSILKQAKLLIRLCEQKGQAIAICHPYPTTLEILPEVIEMMENAGIKIVPISHLIKSRN